MNLILDTAAFVRWTVARDQLTLVAAAAIGDAEILYLSSISIWEVGTKHRRGKLDLPGSFREYVGRIGQVDKLIVLPVDTPTWLASVELEWPHRDPADRVIVATAQLLQVALVTSDRAIHEYYPLSIW